MRFDEKLRRGIRRDAKEVTELEAVTDIVIISFEVHTFASQSDLQS